MASTLDRERFAWAIETTIRYKKVQRNVERGKITSEIKRHCRRVSNFYPLKFLATDVGKEGPPLRIEGEF